MTVREVLEANIRALQNLRVPIGEMEIHQVIRNTINDMMACVDAIARSEAEAQNAAEAEEQNAAEVEEQNAAEVEEEAAENV